MKLHTGNRFFDPVNKMRHPGVGGRVLSFALSTSERDNTNLKSVDGQGATRITITSANYALTRSADVLGLDDGTESVSAYVIWYDQQIDTV